MNIRFGRQRTVICYVYEISELQTENYCHFISILTLHVILIRSH